MFSIGSLYLTYNLLSLLESEEEELTGLWDGSVGGHTLSLVHPCGSIVLPVDGTLHLTLKVAWILAWFQDHFDVVVRVWL